MPYVAYRANGERVSARDQNAAQWHDLKREPLVLSGCGLPAEQVFIRATGTRFFRHPKGACDQPGRNHPGETPEHLLAKSLLANGAEAAGFRAELEFRRPDWEAEPADADPVRSPNWVADVMATAPDGRQAALEFQRSHQTAHDYQLRQIRYWNENYHCLWFASHNANAGAGWDTSLGYPVIAVDLSRGAGQPHWIRAGESPFVKKLLADRGDRKLNSGARQILSLNWQSLTRQAQDRMFNAVTHWNANPELALMIGTPEPQWFTDARARHEAKAEAGRLKAQADHEEAVEAARLAQEAEDIRLAAEQVEADAAAAKAAAVAEAVAIVEAVERAKREAQWTADRERRAEEDAAQIAQRAESAAEALRIQTERVAEAERVETIRAAAAKEEAKRSKAAWGESQALAKTKATEKAVAIRRVTVETGGGVVRLQHSYDAEDLVRQTFMTLLSRGDAHPGTRKSVGSQVFEMLAYTPDTAHELVDTLTAEGFDVTLSARDAAADGCQIRCSRRPLIVVDGRQWCRRHLYEQAKASRLPGTEVPA